MAEELSWWEELLITLFNPKAVQDSQRARSGALLDSSKPFAREFERQEQAAKPQPTPTISTSGPQPTASPSAGATGMQRANEAAIRAIQQAMGAVQRPATDNPLYGGLPEGPVYTGREASKAYDGKDSLRPGQRPTAGDKTATLQEVLSDLNTWSEAKRKKFAELAIDAGLMKSATIDYDELEPILARVALRSAKLYEQGVKLTPWQLLERYAKSGLVDLDKKKALGPITTTSTSTVVDLTSARDANALVDAALRERLGRSPTEKEKADFLAALNGAEKKEPKKTTTTTTTTGSGTENVSSSSTTNTSGGVTPSSFAQEWSLGHNKDEAGSYQALAQYMPLLFGALEAPV